ncbi:MAG: hypothetical protein Q7J47_03205 [Azoarcus sp.]|nr:hypothetical protein [Azoarcus sp.]
MSPLPPALVEQDDDLVPVTVCITPVQAIRLELLLAKFRERHPTATDSDVVDAVFIAGLEAAEMRLS